MVFEYSGETRRSALWLDEDDRSSDLRGRAAELGDEAGLGIDVIRRGTCLVTEGDVGANRTGFESLTGVVAEGLAVTLSDPTAKANISRKMRKSTLAEKNSHYLMQLLK